MTFCLIFVKNLVMKNYIVLLFLLLGYHAGAQSYEEQLKQITDSFYKAFPKLLG
jgi:hypothetical protein